MAMVHWVQMGDRQYAILEGTTRAFARVSPQGDRWVVRWRYGPKAGQGMALKGVSLMQRMIMRWAEHNEAALRKRIPAASKPYEPPTAQERYFYDAVWPGYVPAHRRPRRANRENH